MNIPIASRVKLKVDKTFGNKTIKKDTEGIVKDNLMDGWNKVRFIGDDTDRLIHKSDLEII